MSTKLSTQASTLAEIRPWYKPRTTKEEMRANLIAKLRAKSAIFPGIVGYEDSVTPRLERGNSP